MTSKNKRTYRLIKFVFLFFGISFFLTNYKLIQYDYFIKIDFLFTFIGVFIGFGISLYTYITSIFDKIIRKINQKYNEDDKKEEKRESLINVHDGMKDNINFMIWGLLIVVLISVFRETINYYIKEIEILRDIIPSVFLTVFLLTVVAIWDLIQTAFILSDYLVKKK